MAATDTTALAGEYATLTERCGIVDRSERGKLALTGSGAVEFLNGQATNELVGLSPGEGCYAAFLTHKGKMLGDLRILAAAEAEDEPSDSGDGSGADTVEGGARAKQPPMLLLDTERSALQALFDMIRRFKVGYDVELHKRTLECGLLSLIGPRSGEIAVRAFACPREALPAREHEHTPLDLPGPGAHAVRLIATDVGFDVLCEADTTPGLRTALIEADAEPVSEAAAEVVRVERGRPRYGIDIDDTTIPQEAGLNERAVSFTKGCYVGQETVARLYYKGKPNRHLRGLRLSEPTQPGAMLALGERPVGSLGSSVFSPRLGPIGLALVRREAEPGATVSVGEQSTSAVVVELPFQ
ncbi:MAG TPA: glycine cleavage T C-terminal barrel domain-containing protein [Solirubrobacteraceae bacterium]|nr:glycine cleavage T C-terminal barrel domain-containing protein [Solirubrobacteraceae bacterium]